MSKQTKKKGKSTGKTLEVETTVDNGPVRLDKNGHVTIKVAAKPGAKQDAITGIDPEEGVAVQISAPPQEGEANAQLVKYLASLLGVSKGCLSLDRGARSRHKIVVLTNTSLSPSQVEDILKSQIGR
ncbi:hypothetical protein AAG570_003687 [Ranatra chinensis]|uniref:Uncharacterized protein n=1 Tax=Ranatra chinensis TaxID=642074 RepID=A0ABD0Y4T0_9HEMI